jgi:small redox-active disulfide protein 2
VVNSEDLPLQRTLRIGKITVGLIGLDVALSRVLARSGQEEEEAVAELLAEVSNYNYIPESAIANYREALRREYRRHRHGDQATGTHLSIRILGPGCVSCNRLNTLIFDVMQEMGIAADIEQIHDLDEIWRHGVTRTPALIINGEIKSSGRMPSRSRIEEWLRQANRD